MNLTRTLFQLQAIRCDDCNGHGFTHGLFHRFPCDACGEVGYVQQHGQRRLDRLAIGVIARVKAQQQSAAAACRVNRGTPDNWVLKNNFRGD
ncbi:hypothetical protein K1Y77_17200 (plasmid) [Halomonas qaidamensis]|uniref:Uncharacterized protein n=1 Tax=Halomonas qaidamensis TaxID=2866211 RepID=A0ABY6JUF8_9GAMM|nr:hypothetical protein [Halomonas qaidamensis]UYV20956.1 hypothetical protein K1Y77_17200 [Halomonas qaidamensis]